MSQDHEIPKELNPRQQVFCEEFVKTGNAKQSAMACGCSEVSAPGYANHALKLPHVQARIKELRSQKRKADLLSGIEFQHTLQIAATVDVGVFFDQAASCDACGRRQYEALPIPDLPEPVRRAIQAFKVTKRGGDRDGKRELILTYEYTLIPKAAALELLGKSQGAFTEKHLTEKSTRFELIVERLRSARVKPLGPRKQKFLPASDQIVSVTATEAVEG